MKRSLLLYVAGLAVALFFPVSPIAAQAPGTVFRDCADCPEMVVVPPGSFVMGSDATEKSRFSDEGPQHRVTFAAPFAIGKYELTFADWDACVAGGGCRYRPNDLGWGRGNFPVINTSWDDAQDYLAWLSKKTGEPYRLAAEAEWEYAARAGTTTPYHWGAAADHERANYGTEICCKGAAFGFDKWVNTAPVGSFPPNAFGLYDMLGNVWEWVEDCYASTYAGAPTDGTARTEENCGQYVRRGGAESANPEYLRASYRYREVGGVRSRSAGFRIARSLTQFDAATTIEMVVTVKEFRWADPHSHLQVTAPDDQMQPEQWSLGMDSLGPLSPQGWTSATLKPGDKITIRIHPAKGGAHEGQLLSVTLADGKRVGAR